MSTSFEQKQREAADAERQRIESERVPGFDFGSLFEQARQAARQPGGVEKLRRSVGEAHARDEAAYREETARRRRAYLVRTGVNLTSRDFDAIAYRSNLQRTDAMVRAYRWARDSPDGSVLVLLGGTGCGKTFAAGYLLAEHGGEAIDCDEWARVCGSNWSEDTAVLKRFLSVPGVALVDDLGADRFADDAVSHALYKLINTRQRQGLTVITSNMESGALLDLVGDRTRSRLAQVGTIYDCEGDDLRRAG